MEASQKRKRTASIIAAAVIILALMGGTFMWWTSTDSVKNEMVLERFDVKITEEFDPNTPVFPGVDVTKEIGVTNDSKIPAVVRIQLEESLELADLSSDGGITQYHSSKTPLDGQIIVKVSDAQIAANTSSASGWSDTGYTDKDVKVYSRTVPKADGSGTTTEYFAYEVSTKRLAKYAPSTSTLSYAYFTRSQVAEGIRDKENGDMGSEYTKYITHMRNTPLKGIGDSSAGWVLDKKTGWYYYNQALYGSKGTSLVNLLDKVSLSSDLPNSWQGAKYTLTPHMEAVQYDKTAIVDTWDDVLSSMKFFNDSDSITIP